MTLATRHSLAVSPHSSLDAKDGKHKSINHSEERALFIQRVEQEEQDQVCPFDPREGKGDLPGLVILPAFVRQTRRNLRENPFQWSTSAPIDRDRGRQDSNRNNKHMCNIIQRR